MPQPPGATTKWSCYLVSKGARVDLVGKNGVTVALLEKLGAKNNHRCVSC
jgi:hypothetical protein